MAQVHTEPLCELEKDAPYGTMNDLVSRVNPLGTYDSMLQGLVSRLWS